MRKFSPSKAIERLPEQFFTSLGEKVQRIVAEGHDVINLGQGNPDKPTSDRIKSALQEASKNPINDKYSPFHGFATTRQAVADFYKKTYDVDLNPDKEVALMFGSKIGLFEVVQCLLNPGDAAFLPDPGYPDYLAGLSLANVEPIYMPLLEENGFLPNYEKIPSTDLDRAKLMFLNYPNNPTTGVATPDFFEETVSLAKKHDICVVHDFAYGGIGFDGIQQPSFLSTDGAKDIGIEMYSFSKSFNMAGWRMAFAVGNESVIKLINLIQDHMFTSIYGAIQEAAVVALTEEAGFIDEVVEVYEGRRNVLIESLREIGWQVEAPKGTFFCWFKVPEGYTSGEFADLLLEKAHVVVATGDGFGELGEGYVRIGLLDSEDRLREAAERIGKLGIFK